MTTALTSTDNAIKSIVTMMNGIKLLLKILLIILFVGCLLPMPYGYYQFVRFTGMALFLLFAFLEREKKDETLSIVWLICAVLLNPFIKIALGRTIWSIVDIILSLILLYSIWQDRNILQNKKSESL